MSRSLSRAISARYIISLLIYAIRGEKGALNAAARYPTDTPSSIITVIEKHNYYFCLYLALSSVIVSWCFADERTRSARHRGTTESVSSLELHVQR